MPFLVVVHLAIVDLLTYSLHPLPRDAMVVMPKYLTCLVDPQDDVVRETLKYASEYFPFAQGPSSCTPLCFALISTLQDALHKICSRGSLPLRRLALGLEQVEF